MRRNLFFIKRCVDKKVCVVKKESNGKYIVVLTTILTGVCIRKCDLKKLDVRTFYNHITKGAINVADLVSSHNTTKMKLNQWLANNLAILLHTVRTHAKTILVESTKPDFVGVDVIARIITCCRQHPLKIRKQS